VFESVSDLTIDTIHAALRGLSTRQKVIAQNLANAETPGYTAGVVSFEDSLKRALAGGRPLEAQATVANSTAAANPNGNNVALDDETVNMVETGLKYQLVAQAATNKFALLRTAIGRGV
jgi:flagellar basal-body rod protein FlgB